MSEVLAGKAGDGRVTLLRGRWGAMWSGDAHRVVSPAEVAFCNGRILYAGSHFMGRADELIEGKDWFICPGFINLHGHIGIDLLAPMVDLPRTARLAPSLDLASQRASAWPRSLSPEDQEANGLYALAQMLRTGSTTVVDAAGSGTLWWLGNPPSDEEALAQTAGHLGARVYLALGYRSAGLFADADNKPGWHEDEAAGLEGLDQAVRFAERFRGRHGGRVQAILAPHAPDRCSPRVLRETMKASASLDAVVQIHVAQSLSELGRLRERYNMAPIEYLQECGMLAERVILGHCVFVSGHPAVGGDPDRDLDAIAAGGCSVAHSPLPFARQGVALHTLTRYLEKGINLGIGCDAWPFDIIEEMRVAWLIGKIAGARSDTPTCAEVFHAATAGGATALGRGDLGRLKHGACADVVCIDLGRQHFGPIVDPIRALVMLGTGQDVDAVFIDGRRVVHQGQPTGTSERELVCAGERIFVRLAEVAASRDAFGRNLLSLLGSGAIRHEES